MPTPRRNGRSTVLRSSIPQWTDRTDPYEIGRVMGARDALVYAGQMGLRAIAGREDPWAAGYRDGYFHVMNPSEPRKADGDDGSPHRDPLKETP